MSVYLVILIAWIAVPPVTGFCQLVDCSISNASECSWAELVHDNLFVPVEQNMPRITDPHHLFNFLYNPFERNCVRVRFSTFEEPINSFQLGVSCGSNMNPGIHLTFLIQFHQSSNGSLVSCFKRGKVTKNQGKKCNYFAHEQLRLTFIENYDQLLVEDLSNKVPKGTRLILRKIVPELDKRCVCHHLELYKSEKYECRYNVAVETRYAKNNKNKNH